MRVKKNYNNIGFKNNKILDRKDGILAMKMEKIQHNLNRQKNEKKYYKENRKGYIKNE
jgi:hypothetical protein